jgi:tRNA(adenine34) deaminase
MSIKHPTAKDEEMMEKALIEARRAIANGEVGIAALLLWRDEIIAIDRNRCNQGDLTAHAEMVVLRQAAQRLNQMSESDKADLTLYTTLEPCLMCLSAISFVGIKRVVYSALNKDGTEDISIARGITIEQINNLLVRGPLELVPGVKHEEGKELLVLMGKSSEL